MYSFLKFVTKGIPTGIKDFFSKISWYQPYQPRTVMFFFHADIMIKINKNSIAIQYTVCILYRNRTFGKKV